MYSFETIHFFLLHNKLHDNIDINIDCRSDQWPSIDRMINGFGLVWFGLVWFGLVWFSLAWFSLVWLGLG